MRLLAFSDLHRDREQARRLVERAEGADVVVAAGDFASLHRGLDDTLAVLAAIERPTVVVPGNNETDEALRAACEGWQAATVLHGEGAVIEGVGFFGLGAGVPVTPWDWSFDLDEEAAAELLTPLPEDAVLVSHSPPKGHADAGLGSSAVLRAVERRTPRVVLCGHIHQCWGEQSRVGPTRVLSLGPGGAWVEV